MKVFVTGATGFIGRALVEALLNRGDEVVALVRRPHRPLPPGVQTVTGDILSVDAWRDALRGCRRLYHLAAVVSFNPAMRQQLLLVNGRGTENVVALAAKYAVETTVVVSSACTMGLSYAPDELRDENSPLDERQKKRNPYMESKLAAEKAAHDAAASCKVVVVNPTTVYGPGDWSLNSGALIKQVASAKILPVPSGGSNCIDVEDAVEGIMRAAEQGRTGARYILGGENLTFSALCETIARTIGNKPLFVPLPGFLRLPLSLVAGAVGTCTRSRFLSSQIISDMFAFKYYSTTLAQAELGFKARHTFAQSVARACEFYRQHSLLPDV